jgi:hypothetical protein
MLVTATEYAVSTTSGSGIDGVRLDVYRFVPRDPTPDNPFRFSTEYAPVSGLYPTQEAADAAAIAAGYVREAD